MDKYEYNVKSDKIKKLYSHKNFEEAAAIADEIDWYKVKDNTMINKVADIYENTKQYEKAKEILLIAYERSPLGRQLAYKLTILAIRTKNFVEADEFYQDFVDMSPSDVSQYLLKYRIAKAKGEDIDVLIQILEAYVDVEMDERWEYELAKLYHEAGRDDKCVEMCNELELWFNDGKYVNKAKELKKLITGVMEEYNKRYATSKESDNVYSYGDDTQEYPAQESAANTEGTENIVSDVSADSLSDAGRKADDYYSQLPDGEETSLQDEETSLQDEEESEASLATQERNTFDEKDAFAEQEPNEAEHMGEELEIEEVPDEKMYEKGMLYNLFANRGGDRKRKREASSYDEELEIEDNDIENTVEDTIAVNSNEEDSSTVNSNAEDNNAEMISKKTVADSDAAGVADVEKDSSLEAQHSGGENADDGLAVVEDEEYEYDENEDEEDYDEDEEDEEDGYSPMKSLAESIVYQDKAAEIMRAEEALRAAEAAAVEAQRAADIAKHFVEEARLRANMIKGISTSKTVLGKGTKFEGMTLDEVRQQLDEEERIYERNRRAEEEKNASPSQSKKSQPDSIDSDSKIEIFEFDKSKEGKGKRIGDELTKTAEIDIDEIKINLADGNNIYNTANIQQALAKSMAKLMSESNDETEENPMTAQDSDRNDTVGSHEAAESLQEKEDITDESVNVGDNAEAEENNTQEDSRDTADDYLDDYDNEPTKRINRDEINRLLKANKKLYQTVPLSPFLNQEEDGQIGLAEEKEEEPQIEGQLTIEEVLSDMENAGKMASHSKEAEGIINAIAEMSDDVSDLQEQAEISAKPDIEEVTEHETAVKAEELEAEIKVEEIPEVEEADGEIKAEEIPAVKEPEAEIKVEGIPEVEEADGEIKAEEIPEVEEVAEVETIVEAVTTDIEERTESEKHDAGNEVIEGALSDIDLAEEVKAAMHQSSDSANDEQKTEVEKIDAEKTETENDKNIGDVLEDIDEAADESDEQQSNPEEVEEDEDRYRMVNHQIPDNYREMFDDFLSTESMEENIAAALDNLINKFDMDGTSKTNNVVITGTAKSGKTTLGLSIIKAANRGRHRSGRKVAKVKASVLNKRGVALAMTQIIGTDLIIEQAGNLMPNTIVDLMIAMKNYTEEMLIVIEDDKAAIDRMLMNSPELKNMFTNRFDIEEMEINDMVRIAKDYAASQMYDIDEIGELALYAKLDDISGRNPVMSIEDIQEVVDDAIRNAKRFTFGKIFGMMKKAKGERGVLSEQDFLD